MSQPVAAPASADAPTPAPAPAPAPAPSPAPAGTSPAAPAAPAAPPAERPSLEQAPDPITDPAGFDAFYTSLSDEDRYRLERESLGLEEKEPDGQIPQEEEDAQAAAPESAAPLDESAPLSAEEFAALPPRVQKLLEKSDSYLASLEKKVEAVGEWADPAFQADLEKLLDHPAVRLARREIATGNPVSVPPELTKIEPNEFYSAEDLAGLEGSIFPEETRAKLDGILKRAIETAATRVTARAQYEAAREAQVAQNRDFYNAEVDKLLAAHELPRGDVTEAAHPLNPFIRELQAALSSGEVTHGWVRKVGLGPLYTAHLERQGKLGGVAARAAAQERVRLLEKIEAARKAPTAATVGLTSQPKPSGLEERWGVNPKRVLDDDAYALDVLDDLQDNAEARLELEHLRQHGEWPRKQARR